MTRLSGAHGWMDMMRMEVTRMEVTRQIGLDVAPSKHVTLAAASTVERHCRIIIG